MRFPGEGSPVIDTPMGPVGLRAGVRVNDPPGAGGSCFKVPTSIAKSFVKSFTILKFSNL